MPVDCKEFKNFEIEKSQYIKEDHNLLDFQQYTIYKALNTTSFLISFPTGCGKTFTSLATYFYYLEKYPNTKLIIFTNNSAIFQFNSEIDKFFKYDNERIVIHSSIDKDYKKARLEAFKEFTISSNKNILILGYSILKINIEDLLNTCKTLDKNKIPIFIIYDEATNFKNTATATYKGVIQLSFFATRILALTATLSKGKLDEAYGIFRGIQIPLAPSKKAFMDKYCIIKKLHKSWFTKIVGYKNIDHFKNTIKDHSILINKSDISESLPSFISKCVELETDSLTKDFIKCVKNNKVNLINGEDSDQLDSKINAMVMVGTIHRGCVSPFITNIITDSMLNVEKSTYKSPKHLEILRLLDDEYNDEKIVIYCTSRKFIDILEKSIKDDCENKNYNKVLKITGEIDPIQREKNKELFTKSKDYNIILINTAGIESINLQASNTLIVVDIPKSAGDLIQLLGRISRIGSKHSNLYVNYLLLKGTQDIAEYNIIQKQLFLLKNILGEFEKNVIDYESFKKDKVLSSLSDDEIQNSSIDKILLSYA